MSDDDIQRVLSMWGEVKAAAENDSYFSQAHGNYSPEMDRQSRADQARLVEFDRLLTGALSRLTS